MSHRQAFRIVGLVTGLFLLSACATSVTRTAQFGPLPSGQSLVTLVVSTEPEEIRRQCGVAATTSGCRNLQPVTLPGGLRAHAVRIVRFVDAIPSATAFEIDIHELCHAIASVQQIRDPCHDGNRGMLRSAATFGSPMGGGPMFGSQ